MHGHFWKFGWEWTKWVGRRAEFKEKIGEPKVHSSSFTGSSAEWDRNGECILNGTQCWKFLPPSHFSKPLKLIFFFLSSLTSYTRLRKQLGSSIQLDWPIRRWKMIFFFFFKFLHFQIGQFEDKCLVFVGFYISKLGEWILLSEIFFIFLNCYIYTIKHEREKEILNVNVLSHPCKVTKISLQISMVTNS
jgi:hypothetical protein